MDELRVLIARLGWPSASARWWTMQELAARLGEANSRAETESALLQLLSSRKLESEVVEILCIFWMAAQAYVYSPNYKVAESIPRPSVLSDLFLESFGLVAEVADDEVKEVPKEFKIPHDFDGVQGSDLPRIFRTSMVELENCTRLPFVRQMAFEWMANRTAYPDAPYQGDPWHFLGPLGEGFVGHLSTRTALRAISAYLRTLAVAERFWGMPKKLADERSLLALPVHPTLALLRPCRPSWFSDKTDFDGDTEAIEASFQAMIGRVKEARPSDELIAFNSPVVMSMEHCVEVSVVRWSQVADSDITESELAVYLKDFWTHRRMLPSEAQGPLSTKTLLATPHLDGLMDEKCKAWPLAAPLDLDRFGYLQHDLYPGRLFLPTLPGTDKAQLTPINGQLEIKIGEQAIADFCYWNSGWGAARPMQFGGNCGTALISRGTGYREDTAPKGVQVRSFYLWQVKKLHRDHNHEAFSETLYSGTIFV